jgi:hypothetical protein
MTTATLTGSPKQITWAETIRAAVVVELAAVQSIVPVAAEKMRAASRNDLADATEKVVPAVLGQTSASYWIDRKGFDWSTHCDEALRPLVTQPERLAIVRGLTFLRKQQGA